MPEFGPAHVRKINKKVITGTDITQCYKISLRLTLIFTRANVNPK